MPPASVISRSRCPVSVGRTMPCARSRSSRSRLNPMRRSISRRTFAAVIVRLQHDAGEVDEPSDRCLCVATGAALELLALAQRRPVSSAERPVVDLDRVIGRTLECLDAERHQHREAPLRCHPGERLIGLLAPGLRQPRSPIRRQPLEIEPISGHLAGQERALLQLSTQRPGAHARRPSTQPGVLAAAAVGHQQTVELAADLLRQLRREPLERPLPRPPGQPHQPIDRRALDPLCPQDLAQPHQQQRRPLVLECSINKPPAEHTEIPLAERAIAGLVAHQQPVLDAGRRPDRVVKDRARSDVQRPAKRDQHLLGRAGQLLRHEPQPSQ